MTDQKNGIGWTNYTINPLRYKDKSSKTVWGCVKVSPGCVNCYAESLALRWGKGGPFQKRVMDDLTPYLDEKELNTILKSTKIAGKRIFLGDMTDIFGDWVPDTMLDTLFAVMLSRPDVTFQILTKRVERMAEYMAATYVPGGILCELDRLGQLVKGDADPQTWPPKNIWLGTSVENQEMADKRISVLLSMLNAVPWISAEPLVGEVDLSPYTFNAPKDPPGDDDWNSATARNFQSHYGRDPYKRLAWVVVGGESGPNRREMEPTWLTQIAEQCQKDRVPVFVKQDSGMLPGKQGRIPDEIWKLKEFPA